jgi:ABC-type lipoprotein release transport system permease subunit
VGSAVGCELDFVVDITFFTKKGFVGTTKYEDKTVKLEFDEDGDGLFLSTEMARRIGVKKGVSVSVIVEDGTAAIAQMQVAAVGKKVRISDPKVYRAIGREGGAIITVRRN